MFDQRVEVCWRDAHDGAPQGWHEPEELDREPCLVRTVGWLMPDHKPGHITICASWSTSGHVAEVTCIPLGMVEYPILLLNAAQTLPSPDVAQYITEAAFGPI